MIAKYCKKLKYRRKIVLVTDARGVIDADDASEITKKIVAEGIELVVVYVDCILIDRRRKMLKFCSGVDFDDPDYGFKEEDKSATKVYDIEYCYYHNFWRLTSRIARK